MNNTQNKRELSPEQREALIGTLKVRFEQNMNRHKGLEWVKIQAKLEAKTEKLWSLSEMEKDRVRPDVVNHDKKVQQYSSKPAQRSPTRLTDFLASKGKQRSNLLDQLEGTRLSLIRF